MRHFTVGFLMVVSLSAMAAAKHAESGSFALGARVIAVGSSAQAVGAYHNGNIQRWDFYGHTMYTQSGNTRVRYRTLYYMRTLIGDKEYLLSGPRMELGY